MSTVEIFGRSSSLFTRVARIVAHELEVPYRLVVIPDMTTVDAAAYGGNPALKLPALRREGGLLVGTENICRALAEQAAGARRIVWPEELRRDVSRNAQELVAHAMAAQVQLAMGTVVAGLPADNVYFVKARAGLEGALRWLDDHLADALASLPSPRALSYFEVALFCLLEHLPFRGTLAVEPYAALTRFARDFAARPSAQRTPYGFDAP